MAIVLTTPFMMPNGTRLEIINARPDDEASTLTIEWRLTSPAASGIVYSRRITVVRNGSSDKISRNASPPIGTDAANLIIFSPADVSTPTGYDTVVAAWRGGATPAARKAALEASCLSLGVVDASLTGT